MFKNFKNLYVGRVPRISRNLVSKILLRLIQRRLLQYFVRFINIGTPFLVIGVNFVFMKNFVAINICLFKQMSIFQFLAKLLHFRIFF
jgi:hypothetical protein